MSSGALRLCSLGQSGEQAWCHVTCALWHPEATFGDAVAMSDITLGTVDKDGGVQRPVWPGSPASHGSSHPPTLLSCSVEQECGVCSRAGGGSLVCSFGRCTQAFHVLCGRAKGHITTFRDSDGIAIAFCGEHSKPRYQSTRQQYISGLKLLDSELQRGLAKAEQLEGAMDVDGEGDEDEEGDGLTDYEKKRLEVSGRGARGGRSINRA